MDKAYGNRRCWDSPRAKRGARASVRGWIELIWVSCLLVLMASACATGPATAPVNLQRPGWNLYQGQAVWQRSRQAPEIAGELLLGMHPDGQTFVQFSKGGFPLLVAQSTPSSWQVELPTENKRYSGCGRAPQRLLVLYLPRALARQPLPAGWAWSQFSDGQWQLRNDRTGESLQGFFNP